MANTYKNIVITPNTASSTGDPTIAFSGGSSVANTDIYLRTYTDSNGTLSFEGSAGQLFSISNDLSKTIFSVNDVSGIPLAEINVSSKQITFGQFYGNVGIGTAASNSSSYKLDVAGSANISGTLTSNSIVTQSNAFIGIGASPSFPLDIVTPPQASVGAIAHQIRGRSNDNQSYLRFVDSAVAFSYAIIGCPTANTLAFYTNGYNERMRIDSGGNVGIGISSTTYKLDVNGSANVSANLFFNSGFGSSALAFGCRAWVTFVGSTGAISGAGAGNVSSVTRNAAGDYTVNFTNAMPDTNYAVFGCSKQFATGGHQANDNCFVTLYNGATVATTSVRVNMQFGNTNSGAIDPVLVYVGIFR